MNRAFQSLLAVFTCFLWLPAYADQCINGIPPSNPDEIYIVRDDGTVFDTRTRLIWKRCVEGQTWDGTTCIGDASAYVWWEALQAAEISTFGGYDDWRVPNVKEFTSLVETCAPNGYPRNTTIFPPSEGSNLALWTSSPVKDDVADKVWVDGWGGPGTYSRDAAGFGVRLVRSAE